MGRLGIPLLMATAAGMLARKLKAETFMQAIPPRSTTRRRTSVPGMG
jgi:hypothetical protein